MFRNFLIAMMLAAVPTAFAQDAYPSKPITMIVPFPPAGVADLTARPLAAAMQKTLNQPVIVVNRPGAGGTIGNSAVAKAPADGYTILLALASISFFPVTDPINGRTPAYELKEFAPIARISSDPTVLVVRADAPYRTIHDFIAEAKKPGKAINYGSAGVYSALHVPMEMLAQLAGLNLFHIPYQGGGPAVAALLGGQIDVLASGPAAAMAQIKAGKMRALAGWGEKRLASMPEVPTLKELGYDAEFYIWSGLLVPVATPPTVQQRLRDAVRQAVQDPEFTNTMDKIATPIAYLDAPEFKKFWDRDAMRLKSVLEKIGKVE
jgi:tripartite-type tricarboxylate transporter receptor subunit TctC